MSEWSARAVSARIRAAVRRCGGRAGRLGRGMVSRRRLSVATSNAPAECISAASLMSSTRPADGPVLPLASRTSRLRDVDRPLWGLAGWVPRRVRQGGDSSPKRASPANQPTVFRWSGSPHAVHGLRLLGARTQSMSIAPTPGAPAVARDARSPFAPPVIAHGVSPSRRASPSRCGVPDGTRFSGFPSLGLRPISPRVGGERISRGPK